jgi:ketosteroid isomerase-like protein
MKPKLLLAVPIIVGIAVFFFSYTRASSDTNKAEITALNKRLIAAYDTKDLDAVMACYSDAADAIFFEEAIPFEYNKLELRKSLEIFYQSVTDYHIRMVGLDLVVSGNLAVVRSRVVNSWTDKGGTHSQTSRYTGVDRKEHGKWLVWHEHASVPYDPASGKPVLNANL